MLQNMTLGELSRLFEAANQKTARRSDDIGGSEWKIVVADRGFVLHGKVAKDGEYIVIEECSCIRYWGTPAQSNNSGLGALAKSGPTSSTKLDPQPTTRIHELQIVQLIDCEKAGPFRAN